MTQDALDSQNAASQRQSPEDKAPPLRDTDRFQLTGSKELRIAALTCTGILLHLILRFGYHSSSTAQNLPLIVVLIIGGIPLVFDLSRQLLKANFSSDLLA